MNQGALKGIAIPGSPTDLCLQLFADDTNALIHNDDQSIASFWDCLGTFCLASGSQVNHSKTGIKTMNKLPPDWLVQQGCKIIQDGDIFRLLGIPMGFGVSIHQRWEWVLDKLKAKLDKWKGMQFNMASRVVVLKHIVIPATIYFLSCWRPSNADLKSFDRLCRNFLWSGDGSIYKLPKVAWEFCTTPKEKGGLGIPNLCELSDRMAAKWVIRSLISPNDIWSLLLHRHNMNFRLKDCPTWKNLDTIPLICSPLQITPKGSQLVKGIWNSWNKFKEQLILKRYSNHICSWAHLDSVWFSTQLQNFFSRDLKHAYKLHKKGIRLWGHLWDYANRRWKDKRSLKSLFKLSNSDYLLVQERIDLWDSRAARIQFKGEFKIQSFKWQQGSQLLPLPPIHKLNSSLQCKLNRRWKVNWNVKQWEFRFNNCWRRDISPKKSCLLWLILHHAVWTSMRALRIGKGDGKCCRCKTEKESLQHLFMGCSFNTPALNWFNKLMSCIHPSSISAKELLLGEIYGLPSTLWNSIRAAYVWNVWISRNDMLFQGSHKDILHPLIHDLCLQIEDSFKDVRKKMQALEQKMKCYMNKDLDSKLAQMEENRIKQDEILVVLSLLKRQILNLL